MSLRTTVARFSKGLVWDKITVGALLKADDVVPLEANGGWRTRGGKRLITIPSVTGPLLQLMSSPAGAGVAQLVGVGNASPTPFAWNTALNTTLLLPSQALNYLGSVLSFTHITSSFGSAGANVKFGGEMWVLPIKNAVSAPWRYAGADATTTQYATGTVATTTGSNVITGTGTAWLTGSNLRVGQYITINHASVTDRQFRITRINSATSITVDRPLPMTAATLQYRALNNTWWSVKPGIFGNPQSNTAVTSMSTVVANFCVQHQGRVFVANTVDADNIRRVDRIRWSAADAETDALAGGTGMWGGAEYFQTKAYIDVYPGEGGADGILAMASFGGQLFVFKANGVYVVRGSFESDGRDTGVTVEVVTLDDGLFAGLKTPQVIVTGEGIYWAGRNGLYLMSGSSLVNVTERSGLRGFWTFFSNASSTWYLRGWSGERLILQNGLSLSAAQGSSVPNTLVYYPRLDLWVTQTTFLTGPILSRTNQANAGDEWALGDQGESLAGLYGVRWNDDNDFTPSYSSSAPNTINGRAENPLMSLLSHPIALRSDRNSRIRGAALKAKCTTSGGGSLAGAIVLGEEGTSVGPEADIATISFPTSIPAMTERWIRLSNRGGSPPVDNCRLRVQQTGVCFDARVYELEVEHVAVARTRS